MPIYEFKCDNDHVFEVIDISRKLSSQGTTACPECGAGASRQITAANWQYGSGPKESNISKGIKRVKQAEREGKLD